MCICTKYYKNENGVILSQKEYDFVKRFYGNDYFSKMTIDDYNWIKDLDINNREVEIKEVYDNNIVPFATSYTQNGKKLTIAKSCYGNCSIIVKCDWLINPNVKSYDVFGARLSDTELLSNTILTRITSSEGTEYSDEIYRLTNGFGVSIKLPSSGTNISIEQKYTVSIDGTVYASYQHAVKDITLADSQSYTLGGAGLGNVFVFTNGMYQYYDAMAGLYIEY